MCKSWGNLELQQRNRAAMVWYQIMGHIGRVYRRRCIWTERGRTQLLLYSNTAKRTYNLALKMASCKRGKLGFLTKFGFLCKFSQTLSLLTLPISALCYCTLFSVLLCMWQSVCSSYRLQPNAVSFITGTSCCTVQIHIQFAHLVLFRYTAGIFRRIAKFRTVTISCVIPDSPSVRKEQLGPHCMNFD